MTTGARRNERVSAGIPYTAVLKRVRPLIAELQTPRPWIYWTDLLVSSGVGWSAMVVGSMGWGGLFVRLLSGLVASLAFFRVMLFIHELTHLRSGVLPGFKWVWHLLFGVPFLLPAFLYADSHREHHRCNVYGTAADPEYIPHNGMPRWKNILFFCFAVTAPMGLFTRWAILTPLSLLLPRLRGPIEERFSSLAANQHYRRKRPVGGERLEWYLAEMCCSLWAIGFLVAVVVGFVPLDVCLFFCGVFLMLALLNQIRGMAAHRFTSPGDVCDIPTQIADSVNVVGPWWLQVTLLPVGSAYHALHHWFPHIPYHNLAQAHQRIISALPQGTFYHQTIEIGVWPVLRKILVIPLHHHRRSA